MKLSRLVGLIVMAVLALNLMAVAVASASAPEFSPGTAQSFTGESGTGALETTSTSAITCTSDKNTGSVTGVKTVGSVLVTFTGCSSKEGAGCAVKSKGSGSEGVIITKTLSGELGSVKTTEAASGVGLLLTPATGTEFVDLEGTCLLLSPSPVDGSVAGEATPTNVSSKDGKLIFIGSKGVQKIKAINVLGAEKKPKLEALGLIESSETTTELVLYTNAITVT